MPPTAGVGGSDKYRRSTTIVTRSAPASSLEEDAREVSKRYFTVPGAVQEHGVDAQFMGKLSIRGALDVREGVHLID
ncbi:hypothetical protein ACW9YV_15940 (plasmid) [Paraburkholderia strydomiana]